MAEAAFIVAEVGGEPDTARCLLEEARRDGADVGAPLRVATATTALLVNGDVGGDPEVATRGLIEQIDAAFEHGPPVTARSWTRSTRSPRSAGSSPTRTRAARSAASWSGWAQRPRWTCDSGRDT